MVMMVVVGEGCKGLRSDQMRDVGFNEYGLRVYLGGMRGES